MYDEEDGKNGKNDNSKANFLNNKAKTFLSTKMIKPSADLWDFQFKILKNDRWNDDSKIDNALNMFQSTKSYHHYHKYCMNTIAKVHH